MRPINKSDKRFHDFMRCLLRADPSSAWKPLELCKQMPVRVERTLEAYISDSSRYLHSLLALCRRRCSIHRVRRSPFYTFLRCSCSFVCSLLLYVSRHTGTSPQITHSELHMLEDGMADLSLDLYPVRPEAIVNLSLPDNTTRVTS